MVDYPVFLIAVSPQYEDGTRLDVDQVLTVTLDEASRMYDMADTYPDEFKLYASVEGEFKAVRVGQKCRINTQQEYPFRYAQAPMIVDGPEGPLTLGYVTYTDH